jgi:SAM-dependent methyltransferase
VHSTAYEELAKFAEMLDPSTHLKIGDVGAYDVNGCLRPLFTNDKWIYRGIDMSAGPNVDIVVSSETDWTCIDDGEFDVVVSVSTLEHTRRPWLVVREIARIMKAGGVGCLCAPYTWPLHDYPIDCWRMYPEAMRTIIEDAGLAVKELYMRQYPEAPPDRGDTIAIFTKP